MAPNPDPQPEHFLLKGLDKVFVGDGGNAPALVGWLSYLAHPEEHEGPRRLELWYGMGGTGVEKEVKSKPTGPQPPGAHYEEKGSILRDLDPRSFFAHADVLSGQRLGNLNEVGQLEGDMIGSAYRLIESVRYKSPRSSSEAGTDDSAAVWHGIREKGNRLFPLTAEDGPGWTGDAANAARPKWDELTLWYEQYRDSALSEMMGFLGRFAAIIFTARTQLNDLMGELVDSLKEWSKEEPIDISFLLAVYGNIFGFVLNPGMAAAATGFYAVATEVINRVNKKDPAEFGFTGSEDDGCYKMLDSFLKSGNQVLQRAAEAIDVLVTDPENGVNSIRTGNWHKVPTWG